MNGLPNLQDSEENVLSNGISVNQNLKSYQPRENEVVTMQHALRNLNHAEILSILRRFGLKVTSDVRKRSELVKFMDHSFQKGLFSKELYTEFRERAFNPELNVSDGFYMAFSEILVFGENKLKSHIELWNKEYREFEERNVCYSSEIELISYSQKKAVLLVTRTQEKFAFDKESMFSTKYTDEHQLLVEIYPDEQIVYFQSSNTLKYKAIKTVVQNFISLVVDKEGVKFYPPRMTQNLSFTFNEKENKAKVHENVNPNTVKLLDLLYDLDDEKSSFSDLECIDITFDHEDVKNHKLRSRINTQNYGGGDLLSKNDVKNLITQGRVILEVDFKLYYTEKISEDECRKHAIMAGITMNSSGLRIYIHNNENSLKNTLDTAYKNLKEVFIANYSNKKLRNENKIKSILGLDSSE